MHDSAIVSFLIILMCTFSFLKPQGKLGYLYNKMLIQALKKDKTAHISFFHIHIKRQLLPGTAPEVQFWQ